MKFDIKKINYLESFYLLWEIRENYHGSVALNVSNMIKMFNTTNRTSRFPTRDYSDIIGIRLRELIRMIPKHLVEICFIVIYVQHFLFKTSLR